MTNYLRPQHFHSVLLADASNCSLLGNIKETIDCTPLFLLHSTPRLAVALKSKNKFQNVDIVLKFMTKFDRFLTARI